MVTEVLAPGAVDLWFVSTFGDPLGPAGGTGRAFAVTLCDTAQYKLSQLSEYV